MEAGPPQEDPNQGPEEDPTKRFPHPVCSACGEPIAPMASISVQMEWNAIRGGFVVSWGYINDLSERDTNEEAVSTMEQEVECECGHVNSVREAEEVARAKRTGPEHDALGGDYVPHAP